MAKKPAAKKKKPSGNTTIPASFDSPDSSSIVRAEYDAVNSVLFVTFKHGKTYSHEKFPRVLWVKFAGAESKGRFYNDFIKDSYTSAVL